MSIKTDCQNGDLPRVSEDVLSLQQSTPGLEHYRELHQCEEIREIRHRWPLLDAEPVPPHSFLRLALPGVHHSNVVLVTGVAGGAGATTVVAGLAARMQDSGRRVAVVDLSPGQDLHLHLGNRAEAGERGDKSHAEKVAPVLIRHSDRPACQQLPAQWLADCLSALPRDALDWVFIDCPWYLESAFHQANALAGRMLVVATAEPGAVHQIGQVSGNLLSGESPGGADIHLLINKVNMAIPLQRDLHALLHDSPPARLAPAEIPHDSRVANSLAKRGTIGDFYPDCEAAHSFRILADWLNESRIGHLETGS